jgi:hypothetical protein
VKDGIIFSYLNAEKKGFDRDVRKDIYESLSNIKLTDVEQLHKSDLANKPYTYCIVASDKKVKSEDLGKIGEVK